MPPNVDLVGTYMIQYASLMSQNNPQDPAWQTLIDGMFDYIRSLAGDGDALACQQQSLHCSKYMWCGPLYWIRTQGGTRPPQSPSALLGPNGTADPRTFRDLLRGLHDDILMFEVHLASGFAEPVGASGPSGGPRLGPAGPAGRGISLGLSGDITQELGKLIIEYTALIDPVRNPIATEDDFQKLVDKCFQFIVGNLRDLCWACTLASNDRQQFGLCLEHVWFGLFMWVRRQGGGNHPLLDPSKFSEVGLLAALEHFPSKIVDSETERLTANLLKLDYDNESWLRRHPVVCPKYEGIPEWNIVCNMLEPVKQATSISDALSLNANSLREYLIRHLLPPHVFTQQDVQQHCADFVAAAPDCWRASAQALTTIIQRVVPIAPQPGDKLQLGYAVYILEMIVDKWFKLSGGPMQPDAAGGPIRINGASAPDFGTRYRYHPY